MSSSVIIFLSMRQSIFIRAPVTEIAVEQGRATGVWVQPNSAAAPVFIPAKRVVSGAGYVNTFTRLVRAEVTQRLGIPRQLSVPQSAGFVMANIGSLRHIVAYRLSVALSNPHTPACHMHIRDRTMLRVYFS
jgi:hypothetical protein